MLQEPTLQRVLPGIDEYTDMISPNRNVAKVNCPIFLFHARDDSNEPFQYTSSYARQLERAGKAVEFHAAMRGDHYQSMIDEGIPLGIQWLQSK
jgi:dipeptidyl aminopeptidase/acylaminoacyl peptidase